MKKIIKKCHSFWKSNKNPITMRRYPKKLGDTILEEPEIKKGYQDSEYSPRGFH